MTLEQYKDKFVLCENINYEDYIVAKYAVRTDCSNIVNFVKMMASESSTGTWTDLPKETRDLISRSSAKVLGFCELPDRESDKSNNPRHFAIEIAFPIENIGYQSPMLMNSVIGVLSYLSDIKLIDLSIPETYANHFPGPKYGISGVREYLSVKDRPLVLGIIKPAVGLDPSEAANIFYKMAVGGADIIKDDEKIANAPYSSVVDRVQKCMKAEKKAFEETGEHTCYAVNITDTPKRIYDNAKAVVGAGCNMIMLSPMTSGFGALQDLAQDPGIDVPILVHPDFLGGYSRSPNLGMSTTLSLGKLPRLLGADISDYATPYGTVPMLKEKYLKIALILTSPFYSCRKSWPLVGGGLHPGVAGLVLDDLGEDVILGAGGAIHAHPMGPQAGTRAFRQVIDILLKGLDMSSEYQQYPELKEAIGEWGIESEN